RFVTRAMDYRRKHAESRRKIFVNGAALSTDFPVLDIHENVRTGLHLRHAFDVRVDVVRSCTRPAEDLDIVTGVPEQIPRCKRLGQRSLRMSAAFLKSDDMGHVAGIRTDSF